MSEATYGASDVRRLTGLSRRQLQRWEHSGYLVPAEIRGQGNGSRRTYDQQNIDDLIAVAALIEEGYRVPMAWKRVRER